MIEELWELVMGEEGFLVGLRCENKLDEKIYSKIVKILKLLVDDWKNKESVPKKSIIIISELVETLVGGSRFLDDREALKVENASIEIRDILNGLYV